MLKISSIVQPLTVIVLSLGFLAATASADVVIDADSFKYVANDQVNKPAATDFHLVLTHGQFLENPTTDKFPNLTNGGKNTNTADFGGNTVANNTSINVKFKSNQKFPTPHGHFTVNDRQASADIRSLDLANNPVAVVPSGAGFDITLNLLNDFGATVTGSVNVFVNTGFAEHFNLDEFDTLRDATVVFSAANFELAPDDGFFGIPVHLASLDQYVLITGVANSGDGLGDFAFSSAFSPAEVPEPHILLLLATALTGLATFARTCRRR